LWALYSQRQAALLALPAVPNQTRRILYVGRKRQNTLCLADLFKNNIQHARSDDVRCAAMAAALVDVEGIDGLATIDLNAFTMGDLAPYKDILTRGIKELSIFLAAAGV